MGKPSSTQTVTQKTEIDPIQKSFLFGTPLPAKYKSAMEARNREVLDPALTNAGVSGRLNTIAGRVAAGLLTDDGRGFYTDPVTGQQYQTSRTFSPLYEGADPLEPIEQLTPYTDYSQQRRNGGIVGLAGGGMVPSQLPNLSDRETAYLMGLEALQGATRPQMGYAMGGLIQGPGTGTSDDIPATVYQNGVPLNQARLSDGEVVLSRRDLENMSPDGNADTAAHMVGNSPNGTRGQAAARMYAMTEMFRNGGRS